MRNKVSDKHSGTKVNVFFPSDWEDPDMELPEGNPFNLQPVARLVDSEESILGAIEHLLEGPSEQEVNDQGFFPLDSSNLSVGRIKLQLTLISPNPQQVWINELTKAIFIDAVSRTLKELLSIEDVDISVESQDTADVFQRQQSQIQQTSRGKGF